MIKSSFQSHLYWLKLTTADSRHINIYIYPAARLKYFFSYKGRRQFITHSDFLSQMIVFSDIAFDELRNLWSYFDLFSFGKLHDYSFFVWAYFAFTF